MWGLNQVLDINRVETLQEKEPNLWSIIISQWGVQSFVPVGLQED